MQGLTNSCLVCFRNKCGIWGWRSEKMETVSGYEAKAGEASGGGWGRTRPRTPLLLLAHHLEGETEEPVGWEPCAALGTQWGPTPQRLLTLGSPPTQVTEMKADHFPVISDFPGFRPCHLLHCGERALICAWGQDLGPVLVRLSVGNRL